MPGPKYRPKHCVECGRFVRRNKWRGGHRLCTECGIRHAVTSALDMSQRNGIAWASWQRSNATGAKRATAKRKD